MPSGVELYGQTAGLDGTTLGRIQTGFNEIRAIEGWEDFRIPSYVWDWIDQTERDMLLTFIQHSLWVHRDGVDLPADVPKTAHFVFLYVLFLWVEWWYDIPNEMRIEIGSQGLLDKLQTDWGFAEWAFYEDDVYSFHYIATVDPDGYEEFDGYIHHPYHAGWETDAYKLSAFEIYMFHHPTGMSYMCADVGYGGDYIEYMADVDGATWYTYRDRLYASDIRIADYLGEGWDDRGIPAEGWPEWGAIRANGEHEVLSGRASFKSFGLMDGEVSLNVALDVGDSLTVARGDTPLLTGVVTNVRADLVEGTFAHKITDPVTAKSGEAEYASGNAITAMQEAIEACGGTFETAMTTTETVFYSGDPVDAWQFFRSVCYAVGGVLQYGKDGVYRLVAAGEGHNVTDSMIIGDDRPTTEERTKDYANRVAASIDQEWRTEAVENTIETFTSPGAGYAEITRFGEQIISQEVNFSGGSQTIYTHDYDENGYCVETIEDEEGPQEIGSMKRVRTLEFSDISEDGNEYKASDVIETYNYGYSPISDDYGWILIARTTLNWDVNLDGISFVEEIEQGTTPIGGGKVLLGTDDGGGGTVNLSVPICSGFEVAWPELWNRRRWVASIVTSPVAGPIEGFTSCNEYAWTEVGISADISSPLGFCSRLGWYQLASKSDKSYTVPKLEMYAPEDTHEVHILAKAEDPDAIDALGEHEYECQAVSLDTETGMQAFALGVLYEKGRIRHANVSVPNDDYLSGDSVIWRGLEWQIDTVTVDLDRCCDIIEMVTTSTLARLQNSISREPVSWIEDVKNVVTKRTGLYDNVSRGRILSQVGFRRYLVQAEGKATPVEAKALTDDPHLVGGSVLLVKPTGKNQPWTLLSLSKEQGIVMPATVQENITPALAPSYGLTEFVADFTDPIPGEDVTLSWDFAMPSTWAFSRAVIDDGTGTETEIAEAETKSLAVSYVRDDGNSFTPSITLYLLDANSQEIELEPRALDNGPLLLNYLNLSVTPDWDEPWTGLEVTFSFLKTKTGSSSLSVTSLKARADSADSWDTLLTTDTSVGYSYATEGSYTMQVEMIYTNSRSETETLLVEVAMDVWEAATNMAYNSGTGNWEATFPVDGAFDETWAAGDIGTYSPFIEGVNDLDDAKGIGGKAMDFTLSFGVSGTVSTGKYTEVRLGVHRKYRPDSKYGETEYTGYQFTEYGFPIPIFTFFQVETHADGLRAWTGYRLGDNYRKWVGPIILDTPSYPATISGTFKVVYTAPAGGNGSMDFYWNDVLKGSKVMYTAGTQQLFNWNYGSVYVANPVPADARLFTVITREQSGLALTGDVRLIIPSKDLSIVQDWEEFLLPGSRKEFVWQNPY